MDRPGGMAGPISKLCEADRSDDTGDWPRHSSLPAAALAWRTSVAQGWRAFDLHSFKICRLGQAANIALNSHQALNADVERHVQQHAPTRIRERS